MPNPALVGLGHGGSQDYDTLSLWWASESSADYGIPIEAQCLGDCGATFNPSGTTPNGAEVYTLGVQYDGSNDSLLAVLDRFDADSPITVRDLRIITTNQFINTFTSGAAGDGSTFERLIIENTTGGSTDAVTTTGSAPNSILKNTVIIGGANAIDFGYNHQLKTENITVFGAINDGYEGSFNNGPHSNIFSFSNGANDYSGMNNLTFDASEDSTGSAGLTGFTSAELVDFANRDFRTKSTSHLATAGSGGTFIGAFLESGAGPSPTTGDISQQDLQFTQGATGSTAYAHAGTISQIDSGFSQYLVGDNAPQGLVGSVSQVLSSFTQSALSEVVSNDTAGSIEQDLTGFSQSANAESTLNISGGIETSIGAFSQNAVTSLVTPVTGIIVQIDSGFTQSLVGGVPTPINRKKIKRIVGQSVKSFKVRPSTRQTFKVR